MKLRIKNDFLNSSIRPLLSWWSWCFFCSRSRGDVHCPLSIVHAVRINENQYGYLRRLQFFPFLSWPSTLTAPALSQGVKRLLVYVYLNGLQYSVHIIANECWMSSCLVLCVMWTEALLLDEIRPPLRHMSGGQPLRRLSGGRPFGTCQVGAALSALVRWGPPFRHLSGVGRPFSTCQVGAALSAPVRWGPPFRHLSGGGRPFGTCQVAVLAALLRKWTTLTWNGQAFGICTQRTAFINSRMACRVSNLGYPSRLSVRPMYGVLALRRILQVYSFLYATVHES
jgi:hypothetical protein